MKIWEQPLMMKEGIPSEPSPVDSLRCLMAVLTSLAEMGDGYYVRIYKIRGSACLRRWTVDCMWVQSDGQRHQR
jgi:hypothetical protein